jgi:trans-2,3-dihydro-3-hydroxyanthranilate isomerase
MRYRFVTLDVFTDRAFGGNPLAVLPEAGGLSEAAMQAVAREFNYSETTFVLPPLDPANTARVRIFTPAREIPFAGHPNIGTAIALVAIGAVPVAGGGTTLRFEEAAGLVPVAVETRGAEPIRAELTVPVLPTVGEALEAEAVAAMLGLAAADLRTESHPPSLVSAGLPFLIVELAGLDALGRASLGPEAALPGGATGVQLYTRDTGEPGVDLRVRMFAPGAGVAEDPTTGSAAAGLVGLLALRDPVPGGELRLVIRQGVEMGRPSRIEARAVRRGGALASVHVAGGAVLIAEGRIEVPRAP